jgi:glutamyl-tRNA synthetase
MDGLKWLGIEWKGDVVFQSQRTDLYKAKVQTLLDEGKAYKDASGAVFFKMPDEGSLVINDRVKGRVTINLADADGMKDFVIQGSDGAPKFLLANVIDDGEQGVTHVIRGEDHLTNAAKQICLFRAMGYPVPEFYHVPLIMGDDNHKLSKRHGATSLLDFQKQGFLPGVLMNHLARLAQHFDTEATLSFEDLAKGFDHLGFATKPTKIGFEKLHQRNRDAMSKMDTAELKKALEAQDPELMQGLGKAGGHALAEASKDRATTLDEAVRLGRLLRDEPVYGPDDAKVYGTAAEKKLMGKLLVELQKLPANDWNLIALRGTMEHFNHEEGTSFAQWNTTLRWMLTGLPDGVPLEHTLAIVGRDEALSRLAAAVR